MGDLSKKAIGRGKIRNFVMQLNNEKHPVTSKSPNAAADIEFATKKAPGVNGAEVELRTNFFKVNFSLSAPIVIQHYDVNIQQAADNVDNYDREAAAIFATRRVRKLEKRTKRVVFDQIFDRNSESGQLFHENLPVYDGDKSLFVARKFAETAKEALRDEGGNVCFVIREMAKESSDEEEKEFILRLKHVGIVTINPNSRHFSQDALQFINVALRFGSTRNKIAIGNKIFAPSPKDRLSLPNLKELGFGFHQSAHNCDTGILLNMDRATCVFHKGGKLNDIFHFCIPETHQRVGINASYIKAMTAELKGLKIKVTHLRFPRKLRIAGFSQQSARDLQFTHQQKDENGKVISETKTSVADYFERTYDRLKHPHWPCVMTGSKNNPYYYPLEVCYLIEDQYYSKSSPVVTAEMTKLSTRLQPGERFKIVQSALTNCVLVDSGNILKEFGIKIDPDFVKVKGRILKPPSLKFGNSPPSLEPNRTGEWSMTNPSRNFERPIALKNWVIVELTASGESKYGDHFLKTFEFSLKTTAKKNGIFVSDSRKSVTVKFNPENVKKIMEKVTKEVENLQLIVFMIEKDSKVYAVVKTLGDTEFGIPTQCVSLAHNENKLTSLPYLSNLILKINTKLDGVNTVLDVNWSCNKKIMFVGVDVTHPSPGDRLKLSIASCVGSFDNCFSKYASKQSVQRETHSDIVHLRSQMEFLLDVFQQQNGGLSPNCIVVYRDGVCESQFDLILKVEIAKLKKVTSKLNTKPKLTYVVVQKRHNTRFVPVNPGQGSNSGNVLPGTIVDRDITYSNYFNFFVCSHNGQLGTSRPAHYFVLYDENNFGSDVIQRITYFLSFTVGRCNLPISIPAPLYYAHLSAYRSRWYISEAIPANSSSFSEPVHSEGGKGMTDDFIAEMNRVITVHEKFSNRLYYI